MNVVVAYFPIVDIVVMATLTSRESLCVLRSVSGDPNAEHGHRELGKRKGFIAEVLRWRWGNNVRRFAGGNERERWLDWSGARVRVWLCREPGAERKTIPIHRHRQGGGGKHKTLGSQK